MSDSVAVFDRPRGAVAADSPTAGLARTQRRTLTRRGVLWLGQTCNLRCYFCYFLNRIEDAEHPEHPFMSIEKSKEICRTLRYACSNPNGAPCPSE